MLYSNQCARQNLCHFRFGTLIAIGMVFAMTIFMPKNFGIFYYNIIEQYNIDYNIITIETLSL